MRKRMTVDRALEWVAQVAVLVTGGKAQRVRRVVDEIEERHASTLTGLNTYLQTCAAQRAKRGED